MEVNRFIGLRIWFYSKNNGCKSEIGLQKQEKKANLCWIGLFKNSIRYYLDCWYTFSAFAIWDFKSRIRLASAGWVDRN